MATVTINAVEYQSFSDEATAGSYLAGDVLRAPIWAALQPEAQARALVSATRLLLRQRWLDGTPSLDTPPQEVMDATALLAADISAKPALGDDAAPGSKVKAVGAGSARVEFFSPTGALRLPKPVLELLRDLLGSSGDDPSLQQTAFGSDDCQVSRFPEDIDDFGPPSPEIL